MINIMVYSSIPEEVQCIQELLTTYSMQHSWADCQVKVVYDGIHLHHLEKGIDILISDVSNPQIVESLKVGKSEYPPMLVFPIAGSDVSPTVYVCPEIMPCGLFWRPVSRKSAWPIIEQMMARIHDQTIPKSKSSFRISGKQKVQEIPFKEIVFFEAYDKKIILRMQEQELTFSGTLSQLEQELSHDFIRCHKSFIVNRRHILSVNRTNASISLDNQMEIPISRSYKKSFWEVFSGEF